MGAQTHLHCTGEGEQTLGGFQVLSDFYYHLNENTSTRIRVMGTVEPKRLLYAGIVGTYFTDGSGNKVVSFWTKVEWTWDDSNFVARGTGVGADHMFWKLPPGLDIYFEVDW